MAAKLLHSLTDENPDLPKQIGCMTGIFQLFDRQQVLTGGRRVVGHAPNRHTHGNSHFHSLERDSNNTHLRSASTEKYSHRNNQDKQRISTESSRASFSSSSRSSSFSSIDCNRPTQLEPASYDRILFPETPSRDPAMSLHNSSSTQFSRQSLDIRDLVKDSMYREVHSLSIKARTTTDEAADPVMKYRDSPRPHSKISDNSTDTKQRRPADLKESLKALAKLQEAPWYQNEPRELLRSASYNAREGSSFSVPRDAPRFSYDGREINWGPFFDPRDVSKSTLKLKDIPRLSLDSRESSMRGANADYKSNVFLKPMQKDNTVEFDGKVQKRPPSVVAKLMGLEMLPDSASPSNDANSVSGPSYQDEDFVNNISRSSSKIERSSIQTSRSLWKEPGSPSWRSSDSSMKPMSRFPIEPAPWKQIDGTKTVHKPAYRGTRAPAKTSPTYSSVYSEIEKRLKHLEFTQSGKDLRALKQILEAMQSKGFLETEKEVRGSNEQKHLSSNHNNQKPRIDQALDSTKRRTSSARNYESPIVIMKPAKLVEKSGIPASSVVSLDSLSSGRGAKDSKASQRENALNSISTRNERTPKITQTSSRLPQFARDGSGKSSGSISPRLQQKKLELEKRSRPPTPPDSSKSRRQPNKQQAESNSPGGRRRPRNPNLQQNGGQPSEKSTRALIEEESAEFGFVPPEYSSPVSVLDKIVCKGDSPSPVKYVGKTLKDVSIDKEMDSRVVQADNFIPNSIESSSTSDISRKKLQNIENLVQKLRRLNSSHDEARNDYIASLCENTNPDHRYISEILLASGLLLRELGSNLTNFQFHPSGHPINPELFLVLEQTKASTLLEEQCSAEKTTQLMVEGKFHRKLIFDTVNEILARKLALVVPFSEPWARPVKLGKRALNAQKLLRELCSEIELLQAKNTKCSSDEEDERWKEILCKDVMHQSESWKNFEDGISGAVLDIERSIFKDLVNEIVIGESAVLKTKSGRRRLFVK